MRISKFPELISHLLTLHWKKSGHFPDFCRQVLVKFLTQQNMTVTLIDDSKSPSKMTQNLSAYGSIATQQFQTFYEDQLIPLVGRGKDALVEFKKQADEGHWSWKFFGFIAGASIVVYSALGVCSSIFLILFYPVKFLINVYLLFFGLLACLLEGKDFTLAPYAPSFLEYIKKEALFLYRPYGRAFFYLFVGLFIWANGGLFGMILGIYTSIVGLYIFITSRDAINKLNAFKKAVSDEEGLRQRFHQFDKNGDNKLSKEEFTELCLSLGLQVHESESAFLIIDDNHNGEVSMEEFVAWWKGEAV